MLSISIINLETDDISEINVFKIISKSREDLSFLNVFQNFLKLKSHEIW